MHPPPRGICSTRSIYGCKVKWHFTLKPLLSGRKNGERKIWYVTWMIDWDKRRTSRSRAYTSKAWRNHTIGHVFKGNILIHTISPWFRTTKATFIMIFALLKVFMLHSAVNFRKFCTEYLYILIIDTTYESNNLKKTCSEVSLIRWAGWVFSDEELASVKEPRTAPPISRKYIQDQPWCSLKMKPQSSKHSQLFFLEEGKPKTFNSVLSKHMWKVIFPVFLMQICMPVWRVLIQTSAFSCLFLSHPVCQGLNI